MSLVSTKWEENIPKISLKDHLDRKTTKMGILKMWQCGLILVTVIYVVRLSHKQEFKRRNGRDA